MAFEGFKKITAQEFVEIHRDSLNIITNSSGTGFIVYKKDFVANLISVKNKQKTQEKAEAVSYLIKAVEVLESANPDYLISCLPLTAKGTFLKDGVYCIFGKQNGEYPYLNICRSMSIILQPIIYNNHYLDNIYALRFNSQEDKRKNPLVLIDSNFQVVNMNAQKIDHYNKLHTGDFIPGYAYADRRRTEYVYLGECLYRRECHIAGSDINVRIEKTATPVSLFMRVYKDSHGKYIGLKSTLNEAVRIAISQDDIRGLKELSLREVTSNLYGDTAHIDVADVAGQKFKYRTYYDYHYFRNNL